ncbi:SAM-dependent methyltransferase [Chlorobaculum sp. 24CR]|uniref:SAM-dependent methyltransferase n=1 Tax=Chlorobaculum sp. 24CR TaxID=2508878 RepID=UPI00100AA550|nr:SAM-dependent methyltransferase [Chlorobaculum sp. 24CR]RXK82733.1 SAM-dependent methyltransferase [Chlorobaculum sp. 24CR]
MNPDFLDAHHRHWEDAEILFNNSRLPNADHLYGMAAECGLKRLMMVFGMMIDAATGKPYKPATATSPIQWETKHVDQIWTRYQTYLSGQHAIDYALPADDPFNLPFPEWKAEQRYASRSNFDSARVQSHREGALEVQNLIKKAEIDGLIP